MEYLVNTSGKVNRRRADSTVSRHVARAVESKSALGGIDGIRLFHAERQPLSQQYAEREPIRLGHRRRDASRRRARFPLSLDRRASFQFARCALLSRSD